MSEDFDRYDVSMFAQHFSYFDDVLPAKTDFFVEAAMVTKLQLAEARLSFKQARAAVHDIVHVAQHFSINATKESFGKIKSSA